MERLSEWNAKGEMSLPGPVYYFKTLGQIFIIEVGYANRTYSGEARVS